MTEQSEPIVDVGGGDPRDFSLRAWVLANAIGLAVTYGLFALLGDLAEYGLGVAHDSLMRNMALLVAVISGASAFVVLRHGCSLAMSPTHVSWPWRPPRGWRWA